MLDVAQAVLGERCGRWRGRRWRARPRRSNRTARPRCQAGDAVRFDCGPVDKCQRTTPDLWIALSRPLRRRRIGGERGRGRRFAEAGLAVQAGGPEGRHPRAGRAGRRPGAAGARAAHRGRGGNLDRAHDLDAPGARRSRPWCSIRTSSAAGMTSACGGRLSATRSAGWSRWARAGPRRRSRRPRPARRGGAARWSRRRRPGALDVERRRWRRPRPRRVALGGAEISRRDLTPRSHDQLGPGGGMAAMRLPIAAAVLVACWTSPTSWSANAAAALAGPANRTSSAGAPRTSPASLSWSPSGGGGGDLDRRNAPGGAEISPGSHRQPGTGIPSSARHPGGDLDRAALRWAAPRSHGGCEAMLLAAVQLSTAGGAALDISRTRRFIAAASQGRLSTGRGAHAFPLIAGGARYPWSGPVASAIITCLSAWPGHRYHRWLCLAVEAAQVGDRGGGATSSARRRWWWRWQEEAGCRSRRWLRPRRAADVTHWEHAAVAAATLMFDFAGGSICEPGTMRTDPSHGAALPGAAGPVFSFGRGGPGTTTWHASVSRRRDQARVCASASRR